MNKSAASASLGFSWSTPFVGAAKNDKTHPADTQMGYLHSAGHHPVAAL